ncbi:MAG: HAD-IC family P-type ATPase [Microthrixaceae bacterium]
MNPPTHDPGSTDMTAANGTDVERGLSTAEVDDRVRAGLANIAPGAPSRTVGEILRTNVVTRFNLLIGALVVVVLVAGSPRDALFGGVIVANSIIGVVQELRAKRMLDRLALLSAPEARVVRDGEVRTIPVAEVVLDDLVELAPGRQIIADAEVVTSEALEVDESLLTGEADPEHKTVGTELLSGSFVVSGSGRAVVTRVGADAYAVKLAEEARRFKLANSELRDSIDRIVTWVSWALLPAAVGLMWSQLRSDRGVSDAAVSVVAGLIGMVPEGLVLLTSVAFAVGVVRLARHRTLVQELPAVETLARVDTVCLDKTGTITEGSMEVDEVTTLVADESLDMNAAVRADESTIAEALGAMAAADPNPNATLAALAVRFGTVPPDWSAERSIPFNSALKWSATTFEGRGTFVLGAPEMLLLDRDTSPQTGAIHDQVDALAGTGRRVLLFAHTYSDIDPQSPTTPLDLQPLALVSLVDRIRPDAPETLDYFAAQGVTLKVISGDNPRTVAAVAARAGLGDADKAVDARSLPDDVDGLAESLDRSTVFGRVRPHQKQQMVKALQERGHVVAMTGDGVNDVLALKDADCGIAMASGSEATRAVAQIVLLDSNFSGLPQVVAEGRRVINNLQRVAGLYLTKTVYSVVFAFATGLAALPFPFLPRQLTLISSLCIGIPSFFLAIAPNTDRVRSRFLVRVAYDCIPFGLITAATTLTVYVWARQRVGVTLDQQRTAATIVLAVCSLLVLTRNAMPLRGWKIGLVAVMTAGVAVAVSWAPGQRFFRLHPPPRPVIAEILAVSVVAAAAMGVAHLWVRRRIEAAGGGPATNATVRSFSRGENRTRKGLRRATPDRPR